MNNSYIITFNTIDQPGIQAQTTTLLHQYQANLTDVASFTDPLSSRFFSRIAFSWPHNEDILEDFIHHWQELAKTLSLAWQISPSQHKLRTLIAVSKEGHCLNDLLYRARYRHLPIDVVGVVSNHDQFKHLVESQDIPFHHLPIEDPTHKHQQEEAINTLAQQHDIELLILARYMQILSNDFCQQWEGRCINIHHSFLPSFKGAHPYRRAYERGVKMIGATAHYVTSDLDEGPIIHQETNAISHQHNPDILKNEGRDIESNVLGKAVRWHAERRVFLCQHRTIIFK